MKTILAVSLLYVCTLQTGFASASLEKKQYPIERFTRSISALYFALASCSFVSPKGYDAPIKQIRNYVGELYPNGIPYWALPEIRQQIVDADLCDYLIYDRMSTYRQARLDFTKTFNDYVPPPEFVPTIPRVYYEFTEDSFRFGADGNIQIKAKKRSFSAEY